MNGPQMHKEPRSGAVAAVILIASLIACLLLAAVMPFVWTAMR